MLRQGPKLGQSQAKGKHGQGGKDRQGMDGMGDMGILGCNGTRVPNSNWDPE